MQKVINQTMLFAQNYGEGSYSPCDYNGSCASAPNNSPTQTSSPSTTAPSTTPSSGQTQSQTPNSAQTTTQNQPNSQTNPAKSNLALDGLAIFAIISGLILVGFMIRLIHQKLNHQSPTN